ncbi:MAG: hypothetical protein M1294_01370 [Firmicutes bacterium]|uniref:Camelysin metallo-endopeptidase n=1 Tax=Sulfobacillus benefaciens TaxID=453960 RepID=A0A2T2X0V5_9FIRM|nr:hypothetical protein [Bacillota bacterium]MCL5015097.1 hypothetical protein [Bacillota bacterium]PSR28117.1 MAG: hypothetical protein C7B43_10340 [Sulfobacillus benefaciens]
MTTKTKLIGAGAAVAAMLAAMGASSFAEFTATGTSAPQTFKAGTVKIQVGGLLSPYVESETSGPGTIAELNIDSPGNMNPGDTWTGPIQVTNTGSLSELFTVSSTNVMGNLFGGGTPANITYSFRNPGPGPLPPGGSLGPNDYVFLKPGQDATIYISVHLPYAANNWYQGQSGSFTMYASAVQADNTHLAPGDHVVNPPAPGPGGPPPSP